MSLNILQLYNKDDSDVNAFWNDLNQMGIFKFSYSDGVLYKYVSLDSAIAILEDGTLKYATSGDFNDPFDLSNTFFDFSITPEEFAEMLAADASLKDKTAAPSMVEFHKKVS